MDRLDILAPPVRANPYPYYAELRRAAPVTQIDPGGVWAVSRYHDVMWVLKNPALFSSQGFRPAMVQPWVRHNPLAESLLVMDPPRHTATRALVTHAFGARLIPRVEPIARAVSAAFARGVLARGEIDVCQEISTALPAAVIANLLGLDGSLARRLRVWTEDIVAITPATPPEARPRILQTLDEMGSYLREVLADRRRERRDDFVSDLLDMEIEGRRLVDDELLSFLTLLLTAGFETTSHLLTNGMRVLAEHPELIARLRADRASIPAFVEEVLRFDPPVQAVMRLTVAEVELGSVVLPPGSIVLALLAAASRDESQFDDPERFDMDRKRRASIPFGHGIHVCLGAALARAEARIAFEELLPRIGSIRVTREPEWNRSMAVRGPIACWMEFGPPEAREQA